MNRSSEACQCDEQLRRVVERVVESAVDDAHPGPTDTRELEPYKETRYPVGVVAPEENEGCVDQGREKGSYDDEVAVRDLPLQNASTVGERKPVIDKVEAPPREQQMSERRHDQQKSDRNKDVRVCEFSLCPHSLFSRYT